MSVQSDGDQTLILICPVQNSECQQGNVMVLTLIFWVWKYQVWSHVSHGVKFSHENIRFGWHLSHVRCHGRENIRGRGHISCPGHCRPGASKQLREGQEESDCMRPESCSAVWELNRAENILGSMWTFQSWWTLILIMRGNNVTVVSEWEMNAHWRNADMCLAQSQMLTDGSMWNCCNSKCTIGNRHVLGASLGKQLDVLASGPLVVSGQWGTSGERK